MVIKNLIRRWKWKSKNWFLKKEHEIRPKLNFIKNMILYITLICIYAYLLKSYGIIEFNNKELIKFKEIEYNDIHKELVIAQISSTFLTTAIISLISSIEDKHVLGEKEVDLLFGKKMLGYSIPLAILYIAMIINIYILSTSKTGSIIIALFYLSIFVLIYIISKIGTVFLTNKKYTDKLYCKYYKECEKNIINKIAPRDYNSTLLINLNQETIKLISNNDVNYIKNINMYKALIDRLLFNNPKQIQEYHLDMLYAPSIFNDYIEVIEHFIYFKDFIRAIQYYNWLLSRLNFHNIYLPYEKMNVLFEKITNKLLDLTNEYEIKDYLGRITPIITQIEMQQYFALTNDYSYIKKDEDIINYKFHYYNSNYFGMVYDKIFQNKYLEKYEKLNCYTELFDIFRLSAHNGCNCIRDITNFYFEYKKPEKRNMPALIMGQTTAFLLLKTLQNKDERCFKLFVGMNIKQKELRIAIHLVQLSIIKFDINNENKNIYNDFYGIDLMFSKKVIDKNKKVLFDGAKDNWCVEHLIDFLNEDYEYIKENFDIDIEKNYLFCNYNFLYNQELINQYFISLSKRYNKKIEALNKVNKDYKKYIEKYI